MCVCVCAYACLYVYMCVWLLDTRRPRHEHVSPLVNVR